MNVSNLKHNSGQEVSDYAKKLNSRPSSEVKNDNGNAHQAHAAKDTSDALFLNNIRPDQAREFLQSSISRSINDHFSKPQSAQASQPTFVRNFPTAEATASYIIDDITQATSTIPTQNQANTSKTLGALEAPASNLESLINKIQDGFQQAKEALDQLGALTPGFTPEFEQIQQTVNGYLQFLSDPENNTAPSAPISPASNPAGNNISTSEVSASYESYQSSSQASIQIETRDGDIVTIDLANSFNQQQSSASLQSNNQSGSFSGYVYEANSETRNSFAFTVSGSLDEGELKAISALVSDIGNTIGQFEKGDVNAALNIAKNINTQSEELSNFSFNVKTFEQYRAIDLYQQTQVKTAASSIPAGTTAPVGTPTYATPSLMTTQQQPNQTAVNAENTNTIFPNNISSIISTAERSNLLDAAATVNSIFEKFYEQLNTQKERSTELHEK